MLQRPDDKVTVTQLTDQAFRPESARRGIDQFLHILETRGVPQFFPWLDRLALAALPFFGRMFAGIAFPLAKRKMRRESSRVILPAEDPLLEPHLHRRREAGLRVNVNILGEALLGEEEAAHRLQRYHNALRLPDIEVISVKISTIYSQISPLAREHTIGVLCDRLEPLYRLSAEQTFERPDGSVVPKMVYLDMEEYRDMHLTAEAFMRTLSRPGLEGVHAGIVLQAYLPDAAAMQRRLNDWARARVAAGGAPVMLRLVKGANMEMERIEAAIGGWPQAPFATKPETDANFKRMLTEGMLPENPSPPCASVWVRITCSTSPTPSSWPPLRMPAMPFISRCSRAWPIINAAPLRSTRATSSSTPPLVAAKISSTPSATSFVASTKTPAPKISFATPSASAPTIPNGLKWKKHFATLST